MSTVEGTAPLEKAAVRSSEAAGVCERSPSGSKKQRCDDVHSPKKNVSKTKNVLLHEDGAGPGAEAASSADRGLFLKGESSGCQDSRKAESAQDPRHCDGEDVKSEEKTRLGKKGVPSAEVERAWEEVEFKNWKVNAQVLYDAVLVYELEWPSLTLQWLPDVAPCKESTVVKAKMLLGTMTSGDEPNSLILLQVELPLEPSKDSESNLFKERGDYDGFHFGLSSFKFKTLKSLPHTGESNCARVMPQRPNVAASAASDGSLYIYDLNCDGVSEGPVSAFKSFSAEANFLEWSGWEEGRLVSCSADGNICFQSTEAALTDELGSDRLWASVLFLDGCSWDSRDGRASSPALQTSCGGVAVNCLSVGSEEKPIVICGCDDGVLRLFDARKLEAPLHETPLAKGQKLNRTSLNAHSPNLVAAACTDRKVYLADLNQIGAEQEPEDADDGPPELLFAHGGHCSEVYDVSWHPDSRLSTVRDILAARVVASVEHSNRLHVWQPKREVFFSDESESEDEDGVELE